VSRTTDRTPDSTTTQIALGTDAENPGRGFSGTICAGRVYAGALTFAERADAGRGSHDPDVRLWFDTTTAAYTEQQPAQWTFLAYGGDWGDNLNDGNFCANGIITAERGLGGKPSRSNTSTSSSTSPARTPAR
jgi:beta-galactosidase